MPLSRPERLERDSLCRKDSSTVSISSPSWQSSFSSHEIGHFVAARLIGVKVEEFGIGIPPRIKGWRRNGVLWSLNWIPLGGFVKVLGEDGKATDPESINAKSRAQNERSSSLPAPR